MDEVENAESFTVFMRPLKVKEIRILNRVVYLQEKDPDNVQASMLLAELAVCTLNVTSEEMPIGAISGLVAKMIEYNFPPEKTTEKSKKEPVSIGVDGIIDCFDFLILHGHRYSDIMEYPIPVFNNFIIKIAERLGIKKKPMDAGEAFKKLGIPIKPRGDKG